MFAVFTAALRYVHSINKTRAIEHERLLELIDAVRKWEKLEKQAALMPEAAE